MKMSRSWAMPSAATFDVKPIFSFVTRYLVESSVSVDPFSRNKRWATYTNDLNPRTGAEYHLDAVAFLEMLQNLHVKADLVIFDPPYSPRQIVECYESIGREVTARDTQNARLYREVKDAILPILEEGAIVLSFGWNSAGMGNGFEIEELLLVAHGGAHNDTICMAERKIQLGLF